LVVSVFPAYRQAGLPTGRQASSVPISKENKATGIIADTHKLFYLFGNNYSKSETTKQLNTIFDFENISPKLDSTRHHSTITQDQ